MANPSQKEYRYPKVITHTLETVRARKLKLSTLASGIENSAEDAAPLSDYNDGIDASSSMDAEEDEGSNIKSDPFNVTDYLVDASDPNAAKDLPLPPPSAGRMLNSSVRSRPPLAVKLAGSYIYTLTAFSFGTIAA
ncbi:hypothetical protein F5883DRAFT_654886 [Diaporthe sp. PMI_573]|nr:hypothetical protein F5883DRAFT_654886 [Diaporthaceae sp. PMI_573]